MPNITVVYPDIEYAIDRVESELEIITEEVEAFRSFQRRVHRMDSAVGISREKCGCVSMTNCNRGLDPNEVIAVYRETILDMEHYESEYGEPLLHNVTAEFGPQVRVLLDSANQIQGVHEQLLVRASKQAVDERVQFCEILSGELDSLRQIEIELGEIEREFHALRSSDEQRQTTNKRNDSIRELEDLATGCQSISATRQQKIHNRDSTAVSGVGDTSLSTYLYAKHDHCFPALVAINELYERIQDALYSLQRESSHGLPT